MSPEQEYPTDEELVCIEVWPFDDIDGALVYVQSLWHWPESIQQEDGVLYLATGGWSGNEAIIGAMRKNIGIWSRWICSTRGGAHEFELNAGYRTRDTRFTLAKAVQKKHTETHEATRARYLEDIQRLRTELDQVKFDLIQMKRRVNVADTNGNVHPSWETASHKELLDSFKFQGGMTQVLLLETDQQRERIDLLKIAIREMAALGTDAVREIGHTALKTDKLKDIW
jgi:hypothetical protein